jgi:hypothetical protein
MILDIACGFPNPREPYKKRGDIGIDLMRGYADIIADAHHLPFRRSIFNAVSIFSALDHFQHPRQVLLESARVLCVNHESRVTVSVSNSSFWAYSFNRSPEGHMHQWNVETLKNLLKSAELTPMKITFSRSKRRRRPKEKAFEFLAKLFWHNKGMASFLSEVITVESRLKDDNSNKKPDL